MVFVDECLSMFASIIMHNYIMLLFALTLFHFRCPVRTDQWTILGLGLPDKNTTDLDSQCIKDILG